MSQSLLHWSIARTAANHLPVPIEYVGTKDTFGESGKPAELLVKYGLDAAHIIAAAERAIARKNK
jgi:transketolase